MCLLSIVIPNYNYGCYADRFFASIAKQSHALSDAEILFVDDGSSDDSLEKAGAWAGRIDCKRFDIFTPPRSGKPGPVRNFGLSRAGGKYLVCLDPDDILRPDFFKTCLTALTSDERTSIVYGNHLRRCGERGDEILLPDFKPVYLRTQNPVPYNAMFRRSVWEKGVRYRENTAYEDWDFWIQCLMTGAKFKHINESLYIYNVHDNNFSHMAEKQDGQAKAQIVLNNVDFFTPEVRHWAQAHLNGRLDAPAFRRGYIPDVQDLIKVQQMIERRKNAR